MSFVPWQPRLCLPEIQKYSVVRNTEVQRSPSKGYCCCQQKICNLQRMVEKDVEAGGSVGVCSDNIVVCGAIAEGVMIFLLIMIIILIIGFSAAWSVSHKKKRYLKSIFNAFDNNTSCRLSCLCQSFTQTDYIAFTDWVLPMRRVGFKSCNLHVNEMAEVFHHYH